MNDSLCLEVRCSLCDYPIYYFSLILNHVILLSSGLGNFTCILDQTLFQGCTFACSSSFRLQDSAFCLQDQAPGSHSLLLLWSPRLLCSSLFLKDTKWMSGCKRRAGQQLARTFSPSLLCFPRPGGGRSKRFSHLLLIADQCPETPWRTSSMTNQLRLSDSPCSLMAFIFH